MAAIRDITQAGPDDDTLKIRAENRAARLTFPPSYVLVGVYRLFSDRSLFTPIWDKCRHGVRRGGIAALIWVCLTYRIQKSFVEIFLVNSPRVTGLSHDSLFGYKLPISITTYATFLFLATQMELIIRFFLAKNMRIARERAWELTIKSRGKDQTFWQPYVEEWQQPPSVPPKQWQKGVKTWAMTFLIQRVLLMSLNFYPVIGITVAAWFKGLRTAVALHRPYFSSKKMEKQQIAIFMEERKWDYRAFGFTAALVEGIPLVGLIFSISNRIGAAMWAHDLEKRQHLFLSGELKPLPPRVGLTATSDPQPRRPGGTGYGSDVKMAEQPKEDPDLAESWEELTKSRFGPP